MDSQWRVVAVAENGARTLVEEGLSFEEACALRDTIVPLEQSIVVEAEALPHRREVSLHPHHPAELGLLARELESSRAGRGL